MHTQKLLEIFDKSWASKRVKNTSKMLTLPLFGHTGSSFGRTDFWRGKWTPNSKIPLVLEIRQIDISNKPTWRKFGEGEGLQNRLGKNVMHRKSGATHKMKKCQFCLKTLFFT